MLQNDHTSWDCYACNGSADQVHGSAIHHDDICRLGLSQLPYNNPGASPKTGLHPKGFQVGVGRLMQGQQNQFKVVQDYVTP